MSNKCKAYIETASNTNSNSEKCGKNGKLAPSNIFKSALVIKVHLSDPEVWEILDSAMANGNKYYNDNSDDESK